MILKNDYETKRINVDKVENKYFDLTKQKNLVSSNGDYKSGELTSTTRNALKDLHKQTDYHGDIIKSIGNDIKDSNKNLEYVATELDKQKGQIHNVHGHVIDTGLSVK